MKYLIAHRGNITGPNPEKENSPEYIEAALKLGYDVEVDVWKMGDNWILGHDVVQYIVSLDFLLTPGLWLHTKNVDAIVQLQRHKQLNYFWHETDIVTLTSKGYIWAFPGHRIENSIAVLPEKFPEHVTELHKCIGICSDFIQQYSL